MFLQTKKLLKSALRSRANQLITRDEYLRCKQLCQYSRSNAAHPTRYESQFNGWLSNWGLKHTKQIVLGRYIVDFILTDYNVVIELDGKQHEQSMSYDFTRTLYLNSLGYTVLRIRNSEMIDRNAVKLKLFSFIHNPIVQPL